MSLDFGLHIDWHHGNMSPAENSLHSTFEDTSSLQVRRNCIFSLLQSESRHRSDASTSAFIKFVRGGYYKEDWFHASCAKQVRRLLSAHSSAWHVGVRSPVSRSYASRPTRAATRRQLIGESANHRSIEGTSSSLHLRRHQFSAIASRFHGEARI